MIYHQKTLSRLHNLPAPSTSTLLKFFTAAYIGLSIPYNVPTFTTLKMPLLRVTITQKITKEARPLPMLKRPSFKEVMVTGERRFISTLSRFKHDTANFRLIWQEAKKHHISPWLSAGIAWRESGFQTNATSPPTSYGYSRGEYMILDSTAQSLGISDPSVMSYNPRINIALGNTYLSYLTSLFKGKVPGTSFTAFHSWKHHGVSMVSYNGTILHDQNGQPIPLPLLVALAYNGGPTQVLGAVQAAVAWNGTLIVDPRSTACNFSYQQLDYVRQIAASGLYNFEGYHFSFTVNDVPQNLLLSS